MTSQQSTETSLDVWKSICAVPIYFKLLWPSETNSPVFVCISLLQLCAHMQLAFTFHTFNHMCEYVRVSAVYKAPLWVGSCPSCTVSVWGIVLLCAYLSELCALCTRAWVRRSVRDFFGGNFHIASGHMGMEPTPDALGARWGVGRLKRAHGTTKGPV